MTFFKVRRLMFAGLLLAGVGSTSRLIADAPTTWYVAPVLSGTGTGESRLNAADYLSVDFWWKVRIRLTEAPVQVIFVNGTYSRGVLWLDRLGDWDHPLTMGGEDRPNTIFDFNDPLPTRIVLNNCRNMILRNFTFTGRSPETPYVTSFSNCQKIVLEDCTFRDIDVLYATAGGLNSKTDDITYSRLHFENIGPDSYTHMIYNAHSAKRIKVIGCTFKNCKGDYVRFRDKSEYGVVNNCTFESTLPRTVKFVSLPIFNDTLMNPSPPEGDESLPTNIKIYGNRFINSAEGASTSAVGFFHVGFNPPGGHCLMTEEEAALLNNISSATVIQRQLLLSGCGIDTNQVRIFSNQFINPSNPLSFFSKSDWGAPPAPRVDVSMADLITRRPVNTATPEDAEDMAALLQDDFRSRISAMWEIQTDFQTSAEWDSVVGSGGQGGSVHLKDDSTAGACQLQFRTDARKQLYYTGMCRFAETNKRHYVLLGNGNASSIYLLFADNNGTWGHYDGAQTHSFIGEGSTYEGDRWYKVEVLMDFNIGRYSVWVDNQLLGEGIEIPGGNTAMHGFRILPGSNVYTAEMWVDDIAFYDVSGTLPVHVPADAVGPGLTNIRATRSGNEYKIEWNTNEPATRQVEFGVSPTNGARKKLKVVIQK